MTSKYVTNPNSEQKNTIFWFFGQNPFKIIHCSIKNLISKSGSRQTCIASADLVMISSQECEATQKNKGLLKAKGKKGLKTSKNNKRDEKERATTKNNFVDMDSFYIGSIREQMRSSNFYYFNGFPDNPNFDRFPNRIFNKMQQDLTEPFRYKANVAFL